MFSYSRYWRTWSRVLSDNHPKGPFVEVNLTPIPSCHASTWKNDVEPIRIRCHCTPMGEGDKMVENLPPEVEKEMLKNLGENLTWRLLEEDFLSQIDFDVYDKKCNGGANLEDIKRR